MLVSIRMRVYFSRTGPGTCREDDTYFLRMFGMGHILYFKEDWLAGEYTVGILNVLCGAERLT